MPFPFQVSWVRYRDTSLLSVGKFVYIGDDRFRVIHEPKAVEWFLAIRSVTWADQGLYECQINTKAGQNSQQKIRLVVVGEWRKLELMIDFATPSTTFSLLHGFLQNLNTTCN